jgi:hypothetical protein
MRVSQWINGTHSRIVIPQGEERNNGRPWDGIVPEEQQRAYNAAGFGRTTGVLSEKSIRPRFAL